MSSRPSKRRKAGHTVAQLGLSGGYASHLSFDLADLSTPVVRNPVDNHVALDGLLAQIAPQRPRAAGAGRTINLDLLADGMYTLADLADDDVVDMGDYTSGVTNDNNPPLERLNDDDGYLAPLEDETDGALQDLFLSFQRVEGEERNEEDDDGAQTTCNPTDKNPPITDWIPVRDGILRQILILDGALEEELVCSSPSCHEVADCRCTTCFGNCFYCKKCILASHTTDPFHSIETWTGIFWRKTTLGALGFTMHLGHGGLPCPRQSTLGRPMTILHSTGFHRLKVAFCKCAPSNSSGIRDNSDFNQLLRARLFPATVLQPASAFSFDLLNDFHLLTTQGKLTGYDYYEMIVSKTDNTGLDPPNKRYNEFMRAARVWRHIKLLKRAGVHMLPGGVASCPDGYCAVHCDACPSERDVEFDPDLYDLPVGDPHWTDTDFASIDANFRLKLKERKITDPSLNNGIASIVRKVPYMEHVQNCGPQTEANICDSGLHAVDHANLRGGTAYAASGVGACQCRHMMVRPCGVGDLQKGERYSNMDYVFASSVRGTTAHRMVVSYDIACQWYRNFPKRNTNLPYDVRLDLARRTLEYVIPKFHIAAHGVSCQSVFSLNFRRYMGRTDGENIERGWAWMNPASLSTREMGPGARQDTLDDQWGVWNFDIRKRFGTTLFRRFDEAILQAAAQRAAHTEFTKTFPTTLVEKWTKMHEDWQSDPFNDDFPNPFKESEPDVTMADVRKELNAEETADLARGAVHAHSASASKFLVNGIQLEDLQRGMKIREGSTKKSRTSRALAVDDKEAELRRKIANWKRQLRRIYMPGLRPSGGHTGARADQDEVAEADLDAEADADCEVWDIQLGLPSSLSAAQRMTACDSDLVQKEMRLRLAQADDALSELRRILRSISTLERHQTTQTAGTGVAANTRMNSLMANHRLRRDRIAERYRAARNALYRLQPTGGTWSGRLQVLKPEHVRPVRKKKGESEGHFNSSWIWLTSNNGGFDVGAAGAPSVNELDEGLRIDWVMSLARAERWEEEAVLVPIEMRRVLRSFVWKARWWTTTASEFDDESRRVRSGVLAYAAKQSDILTRSAYSFSSDWVSLFTEHNMGPPSGWPTSCKVIRRVTTQVIKHRERQKMCIRAVAIQQETADGTDVDIPVG